MPDDTTAAEQLPERQYSLAELALILKQADEALETGIDLVALGPIVRDKIDQICAVHEGSVQRAKFLREVGRQLTERARRIEANDDALCAYIVNSLTAGDFDRMPGHERMIRLHRNPVKLVIDKPPSEADFQAHQDYVERTVVYEWKRPVIKQRLQEGAILDWARLERDVHPRFEYKKGLA